MPEQTQTQTRVATGGGANGVFDDDSIFTPVAQVEHGIHRTSVPDGTTVREIRSRMRDRLALDDDTPAFIDGEQVSDDVQVRTGQTLMFMHKAGEKGWT